MKVLGLLLVGAFVMLFAVDFIPIVSGSPISGTAQTLFSTFPLMIYVLGAFALIGAIFVGFAGRR
jgi:hypothetical protein